MTTRWVVGLTSLEFNPPRPIFIVVANRSMPVLDRIVRLHVLPGTTIRSDLWRGYNNLGNIGYDHQTVNHSQNFVDPNTGRPRCTH